MIRPGCIVRISRAEKQRLQHLDLCQEIKTLEAPASKKTAR
jgi:hypothetical protein